MSLHTSNRRLTLHYPCGLQQSGDLRACGSSCVVRAPNLQFAERSQATWAVSFSTLRSPYSSNPLVEMHASTSCWTWVSRPGFSTHDRHGIGAFNQCFLVSAHCFGPHRWCLPSQVPRHRCRLGCCSSMLLHIVSLLSHR